MSDLCGICCAQPAKYKCPTCLIRYCSLACYKPHKAEYANGTAPALAHDAAPATDLANKPATTTTSSLEVADAAAAIATPGKPKSTFAASRKAQFAGLEENEELLALLKTYPELRIQLQSVYGLTLEPAPQDPSTQSEQSRGRGGRGGHGYRGGFRGRGRGRGGYGGAGDGGDADESFGNVAVRNWTKAKGEKEATGNLKRLREQEEGVEEFVRLIARLADGDNSSGTRQEG